MTGRNNDGAGRRRRSNPPAENPRPSPPAVPSQRAGGRPPADEVRVWLDSSDESLDRVVAAAREAQAAGAVLHLLAAPEVGTRSATSVARERLGHRLDMAAQVARTLCPGLPVQVTGPGSAPG